METKKCIAMILAGGRGERLGALTHYYSKPAIYFGSKYRIIDFTLNNCKNSKIDTIGILSQYFTTDLNEYINSAYGGKPGSRGVHLLSSKNQNDAYKGTADAVYRNFAFIERHSPEYVLILASDHVYSMDYSKLIEFHEEKSADVTVASTPVPIEEASRFGIINANEDGYVLEFEEKPLRPKSSLASMGIYVFNWNTLKKYLCEDNMKEQSKHDFGKNILPEMLPCCRLYTYQFDGYWRDVGTVEKLWESNMDHISDSSLRFPGGEYDLSQTARQRTVSFFSDKASVIKSVLSGGCSIYGYIEHSVLSDSVTVGKGSEITNSIIMPNVYIGNNVKIHNSIIGNHAVIRNGAAIGKNHGTDFFVDRKVCAGNVSLVSPWVEINENTEIQKNSHVIKENLNDYYSSARERTGVESKTAEYATI